MPHKRVTTLSLDDAYLGNLTMVWVLDHSQNYGSLGWCHNGVVVLQENALIFFRDIVRSKSGLLISFPTPVP